ncbi:MAG: UDP-N-acetylmuramoyl-L-alanyl-D-glutamate--2,6-diaminopimelate ligase [Cellulosilyticaceae bacterium]
MNLQELLNGLEYELLQGSDDAQIDQIIYDSRIKTSSGLFIAIKGFQTDGHKYIESAIGNGATVVVVEDDVEIEMSHITVIKVRDTRSFMAQLANKFYNTPSAKLNVVGVTGTNGKTSITFLLGQILEKLNKKIGVIGTIENRIGDMTLKAQRTTPESVDLQKLFKQMIDENVSHCLMEVSSHALELNRVEGTSFKVGVFTNLTQDHLDFHNTMDAYAKAKAKLFKLCDVGVVNIDSPYGQTMLEHSTCKQITYSIDNASDYKAKNITMTADYVKYTLVTKDETIDVCVPIPGKFTVYNTLAVIATAHALGFKLTEIVKALEHVKGVPGRIQSVNAKKGYSVIVDYAHTPDGLENVLQAIEQFVKGDIITVFGCGGDRDRTKRPIMGEVAAKYSNYVVITSDNPRSENPIEILDQVEEGVSNLKTPFVKIEDRKEAIAHALKYAKAGDVVLIAGKGHENYQILNDRIIHFDDLEVVQEILEGINC